MPLAHTLENVLVFKPQLEVMMTVQQEVVFREDWHYYAVTDEGNVPYEPMTMGKNIPGNIKCQEDIHFSLTKEFLESIWHSLDYGFIPNPLLHVLVADFLTHTLNEEQYWVKKHAKCPSHFLQNYLDLDKVIYNYLPSLYGDYNYLQQDINVLRADFVDLLRRGKGLAGDLMTDEEITRSYKARGMQAEERLIQDFWDRADMQEVLDDIKMQVHKIINSLFPTLRVAAERTVSPSLGFDVFVASVVANEHIVIKNIGDYRILHWELISE